MNFPPVANEPGPFCADQQRLVAWKPRVRSDFVKLGGIRPLSFFILFCTWAVAVLASEWGRVFWFQYRRAFFWLSFDFVLSPSCFLSSSSPISSTPWTSGYLLLLWFYTNWWSGGQEGRWCPKTGAERRGVDCSLTNVLDLSGLPVPRRGCETAVTEEHKGEDGQAEKGMEDE